MEQIECDVLVIGCGPAGFSAAVGCAEAGYTTVVIDREAGGGTGYRWGCLPAKAMLDAAERLEGAAGLVHGLRPGMAVPEVKSLRSEILKEAFARGAAFSDRLPERLAAAGARFIRGNPEFSAPGCCTVGESRVRAGRTILATGTDPCGPGGLWISGKRVISHRDLAGLEAFPDRLIIIGGDVEGVEFASFFAAAGTEVRIIELEDRLLPGTDEDLAAPVIYNLVSRGVRLSTGTEVTAVDETSSSAGVHTGNGGSFGADYVLITGSRKPNIPAGLVECGLEVAEDRIPVDEGFATNLPGTYALGDINGRLCMAHEALRQGSLFPRVLSGSYTLPGIDGFPRAMFTLPQIAGAGLQESECRGRGIACRIVTVPFSDLARAAAEGDTSGFIKVVFNEDDRIIGIWGAGMRIAETASGWSFMPGQAAEVAESLVIHPTLQEGVREAVLRLKATHRRRP